MLGMPVPSQRGRHCTGYQLPVQNTVLRQQNTVIRQQRTIIVYDVMDINDFMGHNVFACLCCCWFLGFIGIIFSMLCNKAKEKGDIGEAERFSSIAKILFEFSVFSGIVIAVVVILKWRNYF